MKLTQEVVDNLNSYRTMIPEGSPLVIQVEKRGDKFRVFVCFEYPREFDMEWYSITEPGWDFVMVFLDDSIMNSTFTMKNGCVNVDIESENNGE